MPALALLLHIVLSMTACSYMILPRVLLILHMYLEIFVTGLCQTNIYLT